MKLKNDVDINILKNYGFKVFRDNQAYLPNTRDRYVVDIWVKDDGTLDLAALECLAYRDEDRERTKETLDLLKKDGLIE